MSGDPFDYALRVVFRVLKGLFRVNLFGAELARRGSEDFGQPYVPKTLEALPEKKFRVAWHTLFWILGAVVAVFFICVSLFWINDTLFLIIGIGLLGIVVFTLFEGTINPDYPSPIDPATAIVYKIAMPRDSQWHPENATKLVEHLAYAMTIAEFRIVAEPDGISWQIVDLRGQYDPAGITNAIRSYYPQAVVTTSPLKKKAEYQGTFHRAVYKFLTARDFFAPIMRAEELKDYDPLVQIINGVSELQDGEQVIYSVVVFNIAEGAAELAQERMSSSDIDLREYGRVATAINAEMRRGTGADRVSRYTSDIEKLMLEKINSHLFKSFILVQVDTPSRERLPVLSEAAARIVDFSKNRLNELGLYVYKGEKNLFQIDDAESQASNSILGILNRWLTNSDVAGNILKRLHFALIDSETEWQRIVSVFAARELASLWHLPYEGFSSTSIEWVRGRTVQVPPDVRRLESGLLLGEGMAGGGRVPVFMAEQDRATHMLVIGQTGMGKSTLLHNMIASDIRAGRGVALIDPAPKDKNLVGTILGSFPERRNASDVVIWDLSDWTHPPPLNILRVPQGVEKSAASAAVMGVLEKLYGEEFASTRMAHTLSMALQAVMNDEQATLRDVSRLFRDGAYRTQMTEKLDSIGAEEFWDDFESMSESAQREYYTPILQRLERFYNHPVLYPVLCHPQGMDFSQLIQSGKVILISLAPPSNAPVAPREQHLIGSLIVSMIELSIMAKAAPRQFYLYVDEAEHFVTTSIKDLFNEARGQRLSLILSNQFLKQLAGDTLNAVMGNVGAMIAFRVGDEDARVLDNYTKPQFSSYDLSHLGTYEAAVFMRTNRQTQPAFSLFTLEAPDKSAQERQRSASRRQNTSMTREEVLQRRRQEAKERFWAITQEIRERTAQVAPAEVQAAIDKAVEDVKKSKST